MLIYLAVLLVPLTMGLAFSGVPGRRPSGLWVFFFLLLLFCGLRFEVGTDWLGYEHIFELTRQLDLSEALSVSEPGFSLLNLVSDWLGLEFAGVVFLGSLIFLYGCFRFAQQTANPWLALAVVLPYLVFVISMSGIRQACAIGIGYGMLAGWGRIGTARKILLIALAASFHNSAIVFLIFLVFGLRKPMYFRVLLALAVAAVVAASLQSSTVDRYRSTYVEENLVSEGALFHVMLTAFPAILYLIFRKKLLAARLADTNVMIGCCLTLLAMPFLVVSSTGIDRLTLYFSFVQMWTYPALLHARVLGPGLLKLGISTVVAAVFLVYFLFGSHVTAFVPYRNLLLSTI